MTAPVIDPVLPMHAAASVTPEKTDSTAAVSWRRGLALSMLTATLLALKGCAISTPWPRLAPAQAERGDDLVVLVLTRVVVDPEQRNEFDRQNSRVIASMGGHPGLIGYAARRELLGDQGWTLSVWADEDARAAFVRSPVHRTAIAESLPAVRGAEFKRLTLARKDLPGNWDQVLRLLAEPEGRRNYWD